MYLFKSNENLQEGHELMNLQTGELISRPFVKAAPMPQWVIERVENLGRAQGMKSLKFFNRKREEILFNDPDHAGVNWDEDLDDQEDENLEDLNDPDPNQLLVETDGIERSGVEEEEEKEDVVIESENNNSDNNNNNSNSESENIYFNSEIEDDDQENEEFAAEENSDSDDDDLNVEECNSDEEGNSDEADNDNLKVTSRSGREIKKANDPLNNIATMKGKSYVNVSEGTSKRTKFEETGKKVQFSDENVARMKEIQYNFSCI